MTHIETINEADDLTLFTRFPDPTRRHGCVVAIADRETRLLVADHLEHLGYDVWAAVSGLSAYRACAEFHANMDVLVCDENLPDLPPLVLFNRLKAQLPGLQCCVLASVKHRESVDEHSWAAPVVMDVAGWRSGMLFVNVVVTTESV
ncbi:response regulator : [Gemmata massiliana]|uniref:Response regulator n=1 Tax=Gemmata massiliana TaxID=1210884 RepID=A0A6P2CXS5_9BACT|nr:response regulator [Gemmata massiliana]VTR93801.1 response regulator : [Gemmata massiliana]